MSKDLKTPEIVRVIGIDPSTTNMGVCVIDVDLTTKTPFKLVYVNTIKGDKVLYDIPVQYDDTAATSVAARSFCLARALGEIIDFHLTEFKLHDDGQMEVRKRHVTGIIEDNFLGAAVLTFKQLVQFVSLAQDAYISRGIHVSSVLPNPAKDIVGANFKGSQKEDVQKGVVAYEHLDSTGFDLTVLDDHSADSVAVTLYRCEMIAKHYGVYHERSNA